MERWIIRRVGGSQMLRVREGQQFEWADVIHAQDWIGRHSDEELSELGFEVEHVAIEAPLEPERPVVASRRQFFKALALRGLISQAEALAAVTINAIPAALQTEINKLPETERFGAEMDVAGAAEFDSRHPLTVRLGSGLMSPTALIEFFAFAKTL